MGLKRGTIVRRVKRLRALAEKRAYREWGNLRLTSYETVVRFRKNVLGNPRATFVFFTVLVLLLLWATVPVGPVVGAAFVGWWFAFHQRSEWAKTPSDFLYGVWLGLTPIAMLDLALKLLAPWPGPVWVAQLESTLWSAHYRLASLEVVPLRVTMICTVLLIVANHLAPRLRPMEWYRLGTRLLHLGAIILTAATSFTFYSPGTYDALIDDGYGRILVRYHAQNDEKANILAERVAAENIISAPQMNPKETETFTQLLQAIHNHASCQLSSVPQMALSGKWSLVVQCDVTNEVERRMVEENATKLHPDAGAIPLPEAGKQVVTFVHQVMRQTPRTPEGFAAAIGLVVDRQKDIDEAKRLVEGDQEEVGKALERITDHAFDSPSVAAKLGKTLVLIVAKSNVNRVVASLDAHDLRVNVQPLPPDLVSAAMVSRDDTTRLLISKDDVSKSPDELDRRVVSIQSEVRDLPELSALARTVADNRQMIETAIVDTLEGTPVEVTTPPGPNTSAPQRDGLVRGPGLRDLIRLAIEKAVRGDASDVKP